MLPAPESFDKAPDTRLRTFIKICPYTVAVALKAQISTDTTEDLVNDGPQP